ncbi:MAG TPA: preprotein translocase subunit SecG [Myxococcota bacterium]|jgi:preprotein translocase subunit SecG|nr:preprotein translocase subunit SecG [Myxococcota bacterium]
MGLLFGFLVAFHVVVSLLLVVMILLQPGKGGGMGAVFGGGSSTSVFGGRGATTILSKGTGILAALFFVLSIAIAMTGSERSVTTDAPAEVPVETGAAPASDSQ